MPLGNEIVDAERALDHRFSEGTIEDATLRGSVQRIGELQGRLRAVHLSAHLATRTVLTTEQGRYRLDRCRARRRQYRRYGNLQARRVIQNLLQSELPTAFPLAIALIGHAWA